MLRRSVALGKDISAQGQRDEQASDRQYGTPERLGQEHVEISLVRSQLKRYCDSILNANRLQAYVVPSLLGRLRRHRWRALRAAPGVNRNLA